MTYEISEIKLTQMLESAAETGANRALKELGLIKNHISQRDAYRRFGETRVTRWRKSGSVTPVKQGGIVYYSLQKLNALSKVNNLI